EVRARVDHHGVVEGGRIVVVAGLVVGLGGDDQDTVAVGVVDGGLSEGGVVDGAQGLLYHAGPVVHGVDDGAGEVVDVGHEGVSDPQGHEHAVAAHAQGLLQLARGVLGLARPVAVGDVVGRVVVPLVEVPAGYVVEVAVGVVVDPVGGGADEGRGGQVGAVGGVEPGVVGGVRD